MVESTTIEPVEQEITDLRASPAQHLHIQFAQAAVVGSRGVRLREEQFLGMVGLRLSGDSRVRHRVASGLGGSLPSRCGEVATGPGVATLWLSPDEFLVVTEGSRAATTVTSLLAALGGTAGAVVDLSANRTTLRLEGPAAREVLEKGCPLDLHPRSFEAGTAFSTNIGRVPVLLWKLGEETYRIMPRASFADFLGRWLVDAMAEYKVPETV